MIPGRSPTATPKETSFQDLFKRQNSGCWPLATGITVDGNGNQ